MTCIIFLTDTIILRAQQWTLEYSNIGNINTLAVTLSRYIKNSFTQKKNIVYWMFWIIIVCFSKEKFLVIIMTFNQIIDFKFGSVLQTKLSCDLSRLHHMD